MKKEIFLSILAGLIIALFFYVGFSKYLDMRGFREAMERQPLPLWSIKSVTLFLPGVEILVALFLLIPKTRLVGFYASAILMFTFTMYVGLGMAKVFGNVPCSCGGVIHKLTWPQHLVFNIFFLGVALLGIAIERRSKREIGSHSEIGFS